MLVERLDIEIPSSDSDPDATFGEEVGNFIQVYTSASVTAAAIVTNGGTNNTFYYALPGDCPTVCTVCTAGCLFTTTSGYVGVGIPDKSMLYSNTPSNTPGSWFGIATTAGRCTPGMDIGAVTGNLVKITGMNATYSSITGTRVSAASSNCGVWEVAIGRPTYPATLAPTLPTVAPSFRPTQPTLQPSTAPPTVPLTCAQIPACSSSSVICPVPGFNYLTEGGGAVGTYYYVLHGDYPVVYNASVTITVNDLNNGTDTTTCTQDYSRSLDDVSFLLLLQFDLIYIFELHFYYDLMNNSYCYLFL